MTYDNKIYIRFIIILGILFVILSYFVVALQIYYKLIILLNMGLNTIFIIFGVVFNIFIIKLLSLKDKLISDVKILRVYILIMIIIMNIFDWLIRRILLYHFGINGYIFSSYFVGFGGGILASFAYLLI